MKRKEVYWGIIRYTSPIERGALFDGWYGNRQDAEAVYLHWSKLYPNWNHALVNAELKDITGPSR